MAEADVHTLTGAHVCDALGKDERVAFEVQMDQCPECAAEVRELREVAAIMATAVTLQPPASLQNSLDTRIRITRQLPPATDPAAARPTPRDGRRRLRAAWSIAAALALLAAGLGWRAVDQQQQISALNAQTTQISSLLAAPDVSTARVAITGHGAAGSGTCSGAGVAANCLRCSRRVARNSAASATPAATMRHRPR